MISELPHYQLTASGSPASSENIAATLLDPFHVVQRPPINTHSDHII
jgi:hypothetical protein